MSAEKVANELAQQVRRHQSRGGALGEHLADQWMLPLALAVWKSQAPARFSCTELTEHATTNMQVIERFLPCRFDARIDTRQSEVRVLPDDGDSVARAR